MLRRRLLGEAIERADAEGDTQFLADLAEISIAGGEARLTAVVGELAGHDEALATLRREAVTPMLRRGFGLAEGGDAASALQAAMARFDADAVAHLADAFMAHGASTAKAAAEQVRGWIGTDDRAAHFERLRGFFLTGKNEPRSAKAVPAAAERAQPGLCELFTELAAEVRRHRRRTAAGKGRGARRLPSAHRHRRCGRLARGQGAAGRHRL